MAISIPRQTRWLACCQKLLVSALLNTLAPKIVCLPLQFRHENFTAAGTLRITLVFSDLTVWFELMAMDADGRPELETNSTTSMNWIRNYVIFESPYDQKW